MKLPELKEIAKELGLRGLSAKRKGDLVAAIEEARAKQSSAKSETAPAQAEQPAGHDDAVSVQRLCNRLLKKFPDSLRMDSIER